MKRRLTLCALVLAALPGRAEEVLRVATYGLPSGLGNPHSSTSISEMYVWTAIFDSLTRVDGAARVLPALAVSWESRNELTWQFRLREGVRFSNGEPFNAAAVAATVDYITSEAAARDSVAREFVSLKAARVLDEYAVEFTTHEPTLVLPAMLAGLRIVAPGQWQRLGPEGFARAPIGTGPFQVDSWEPARVSLSAFRDSWRAPRVDRMEIYEILEQSARRQGIQSGRLDIALGLMPDDVEALERTGDTPYISPGAGVVGMSFITVKDSPVKDKRVRQALNYAVDKDIIVDVLFKGHARPAGQPAPHYVRGYNPDLKPYPYDPQRARTLLAEAGYPDGFDMLAELVLSGTTAAGALYSFIIEHLAAVGVRQEVRNIPIGQLITKAVTGSFVGEGFGMEWDFKPTLDAMRAIPMHSCQRLVPWHCDPATMPLIEAAQREFDSERRLEMLRELMRIYAEDPTMLYLYETMHFDGVNKRVRNFAPVNRLINYHEIEVAE
jgi:peptide/nickel transport system substrate-binding protein